MKRITRRSIGAVLPLLLFGTLSAAAQDKAPPEFRPALLVIDLQNEWMPNMAEEDRASAPQKINEVIALFRELGLPIIRIYHSSPERGPAPNTEEFEFDPSIAVTDEDPRVIKSHPSAFTGTDLERRLRDMDRDTVALCGMNAKGCVLATYFGAFNRDFHATLVKGALLSGDATETAQIADIFHSMSIEGMRDAFGAK